jgi:hypothetical protein
MASSIIPGEDDAEWSEQRFLVPRMYIIPQPDPEKFPTFLNGLSTQESDEAKVITALGRPISGLELVRLT